MFLKRIEIQGFKSFADKTILQFDQNITGIVGPNGCGKSNVNDAIRWVLGEQSTKSLRSGSSMSDIIFSGSEYRKPVNMAKVTLVFDNTGRVFDSPYDEIEITRQLMRSTNEASYFINKTPCRLKDISDLIMDTGLGRDSLSIITQGNISAFAEAKPEDRRLLFEEAAGVAKYKKRKKTSLSKLEKTQENLDRIQDIMEELEKQLVSLKEQAEKAKKYRSLKAELSSIEISVLVEEIEAYHEELRQIQESTMENNALLMSSQTLLSEREEAVSVLRKEMYALDKEINDLQGQYTSAMEENYRLEKRKVEMDEKRKYRLSLADARIRAEELKRMVQEAAFEYEDRKKRLQDMRNELNLRSERLNRNKRELSEASTELYSQQQVLQQLSNRKQMLENIKNQPYAHQQGVRTVMESRHALQGIEGTVADLIIAHPDRAQAINAALGGSVYNIVTTDEACARQAIHYLKKNRGGRATFLPLSVMRGRFPSPQQQIIASQSEGTLGWANENVDCDGRYNEIRDRLLGNVLIVDTLVHANECAKRLKYQIKIVTLDGEIVHVGGSMTGGAGRHQSSPVTVARELDEVRSRTEGQQLKVNNLKEEVRALENKLDNESETIVQLQIDLAKLENIYQVKKEKYESLQQELKGLDLEEESADLQDDDLVVLMSRMHEKIDEISNTIQGLRKRRYDKGVQAEQTEAQIRQTRRECSAIQSQLHHDQLEQTKKQTLMENALERLNRDYQLTYDNACSRRVDIDLDQARDQVKRLRSQIQRLGNINQDAPEQYDEIFARYTFLDTQKKELEEASATIRKAIDEMDETMKVQFTDMFHKINKELDGIFKAMFGGGKARLSMVDPDDVLNTGIEIDVQPPGKTVKNLQSFSGGEKALIAISVLFAILQARTMPLCIFDEVEAALDQANVERFARYLSRFSDRSQFIVVTHRPGTMEQCDTLYGITMQKDGVSKLLKVQLKDAVHIAQKEG